MVSVAIQWWKKSRILLVFTEYSIRTWKTNRRADRITASRSKKNVFRFNVGRWKFHTFYLTFGVDMAGFRSIEPVYVTRIVLDSWPSHPMGGPLRRTIRWSFPNYHQAFVHVYETRPTACSFSMYRPILLSLGGVLRSLVFVRLSVCDKDNSRTRLRMSTNHGRHGRYKWLRLLVLIRIRIWI